MKRLLYKVMAVVISLTMLTSVVITSPIIVHADNTATQTRHFDDPNWAARHEYDFWNWFHNWAYQAPQYWFETVFPADQWGTPTTSNVPAQREQNIRRDRHAAYLPPNFGTFSGVFDTQPVNPFMPNTNNSGWAVGVDSPNMALQPGDSGVNVRPDGTQGGGFLPDTSVLSGGSSQQGSGNVGSPTGQAPPDSGQSGGFTVTHRPVDPPVTEPGRRITAVTPFADGTIGRITIPVLRRTAAVRPGLDMRTLDHYVGHFPTTSQWDGNVALASHNRGPGSFFAGIWDLQIGDHIIYETTHGVRVYEVISITRIAETDTSNLAHSHENVLTLVTCVAGQQNRHLRYSIRAREIS